MHSIQGKHKRFQGLLRCCYSCFIFHSVLFRVPLCHLVSVYVSSSMKYYHVSILEYLECIEATCLIFHQNGLLHYHCTIIWIIYQKYLAHDSSTWSCEQRFLFFLKIDLSVKDLEQIEGQILFSKGFQTKWPKNSLADLSTYGSDTIPSEKSWIHHWSSYKTNLYYLFQCW